MKFLNFDKVLCLSPHPDDVEYSLAGTVLKYKSTHFDLLCLTQGGDCDKTTSSSRLQEVVSCWNIANCSNYSLFFTPYKFLKELEEDEWINYIEEQFTNTVKYDALFIPSTEDSHFEHRQVSLMGFPLARTSLLPLIEYYSPSTLESWVPNTFVDIKDQIDTKVKMLNEFRSQLHRSYFSEKIVRGFHNNFQCSKKGLCTVEQFRINQVYF